MRKVLLLSGVFAAGFLASCGGGGGGSELPESQFINVSGQITAGTSAQSLSTLANCPTVNGGIPYYVIAVTIDGTGKPVAAGSTISQNCSFNLNLNKNYSYAIAIFDQNRLPLAVFIDESGNKVFKFLGNTSLTATVNGNQVKVTPNNSSNMQGVNDPNVAGAVQNPQNYDMNSNGVPDFMEDKDNNGKMDCLEDKDGNGHPDSLEDENRDGILDYHEDHDFNGHPEYHDCNGNGRFDDEREEGYEGEEGYECGGAAQPPAGGNQGGNQSGGGQGNNQGGGGATTVSFANDVYPILRSNCAGCHGGNGNFRVGSDASSSYSNLMNTTPATSGYTSFIDTNNPSQSLLLLKATNSIGHGGGQVIASGSQEYQKILQWIQAGAPNN